MTEDIWNRAYEANRRLAAMYDGFITRIVEICSPHGTYLDVGCNNGFFPVRASQAGIRIAVGTDLGDFSGTFGLLNEITGASARFSVGAYDSPRHALRMGGKGIEAEHYDVVSASAVLCHLPDPLHFLKAIADVASRAVFIWNTFVESDDLLIRYSPPNRFCEGAFPNGFDDNTSISLGLLFLSMSQLVACTH